MKAVLLGASHLALATARLLSQHGHQVVIIERERDRIDELAEQLDCGFLHGDGTRPAVLAEAGPGDTDLLFCLTGNDQANIIASLVGRSLGFSRVITKIEDQEFEHICAELSLHDVIVPDRAMAQHLGDIAEGRDQPELIGLIRGNLRLRSLVVDKTHSGNLNEVLPLPRQSRVVCLYRSDQVLFPAPDGALVAGDELLIACHSSQLDKIDRLLRDEPNDSSDD